LASASFADCSRSLRFLKRLRLTTSPITIPHETELEDATILKTTECSEKPRRAPASPVFISRKSLLKRPVITSKDMFRSAKA
jgi:hypothetical protein